MMQSEWK